MIKENKDFIVIDFTGLFKALWKKMWLMLVAGVLCAVLVGGVVYYRASSVTAVPMYTSTAKLYVTGNVTTALSTNTKILGQSFFADYYELMKSEYVTSHVIQELQLNMTAKELISCVRYKWITDTCMVYISVTFPEPQLAKEILDALLKITSAYAFDIMGMTPPTVYEPARVAALPNAVASVNITQYVIIGFAAGFALVFMIVICIYLFDKKLRNYQQASDKTGLSTFSVFLMDKSELNGNAMKTLFGRIYTTQRDAQVIAFLGAGKENKEQVISCYGDFLSKIGKSVLFLDVDFTMPCGSNGNDFAEYLAGATVDVEKLIYERNGMNCIDCAEPVANAVELFGGDVFRDFLLQLKGRYDYILLNTASMEYSEEAAVVMEQTDLNLFVVEEGKTTLAVCEKVAEQYNVDNKVAGLIVSNVKAKKHGREFGREYGKFVGIK